MKFHKATRWSAGIFLALTACLNNAHAAVVLSLTDESAPFNSVTINSGDSFSVAATLFSDSETLVGVSYLATVSNNGAGLFTISARDITNAPYTSGDLTTSNSVLLNGSNNILDPSTNVDLGATFAQIAPGSYQLAVFTVNTSNALPVGTYTLSFSLASATDSDFNEITPSTNTYNITVVPEPSLLFLLLGGMTFLALIRRRGPQTQVAFAGR